MNWDTLILFQISYKAIFLLLSSLASRVFDFILKRTNLSYVTTENVMELLKHPIAILFFVLFLFLVGFSIYIEVIAIVIYCKKSAEQERITFFHLYEEIL